MTRSKGSQQLFVAKTVSSSSSTLLQWMSGRSSQEVWSALLYKAAAEVNVMTETIWRCEQWFGGVMQAQQDFPTEDEARAFARKVSWVAPDLVLKIEPMPIHQVWN